MVHLTAAEALDKYEPVILRACIRVWQSTTDARQFTPCELPDLIQAARLRILETWPQVRAHTSVAPYMRKTAATAARLCLRRERRQARLPVNLAALDAA